MTFSILPQIRFYVKKKFVFFRKNFYAQKKREKSCVMCANKWCFEIKKFILDKKEGCKT